jgi:tRNA-dihydrouridine synthase B
MPAAGQLTKSKTRNKAAPKLKCDSMNKTPRFKIGDVPIDGDLILAPMDGFTDQPFRGICRKLGSAMSVTEFINSLDVLTEHPRYHHRLAFKPFHRPLSLQMLGDDAIQILRATEQLLPQVQPDIIDINLGCQSKNVTSRGAGAALMREPEKIAEIFKMMTDTFDLPISGKIRLGWNEDHLNYLEVAKTIQDNGGAMVAVHGRTRAQAYRGQARWEPIREVKAALSIPVIGNGDVRTIEDIRQIKALTHCDGVMIGRAAVGNPWIFSGINREDVPLEFAQKVILEHFHAILGFFGDRGVITFRKYLKAYLKPFALSRDELLILLKSKDHAFVEDEIKKIFNCLDLTHPPENS